MLGSAGKGPGVGRGGVVGASSSQRGSGGHSGGSVEQSRKKVATSSDCDDSEEEKSSGRLRRRAGDAPTGPAPLRSDEGYDDNTSVTGSCFGEASSLAPKSAVSCSSGAASPFPKAFRGEVLSQAIAITASPRRFAERIIGDCQSLQEEYETVKESGISTRRLLRMYVPFVLKKVKEGLDLNRGKVDKGIGSALKAVEAINKSISNRRAISEKLGEIEAIKKEATQIIKSLPKKKEDREDREGRDQALFTLKERLRKVENEKSAGTAGSGAGKSGNVKTIMNSLGFEEKGYQVKELTHEKHERVIVLLYEIFDLQERRPPEINRLAEHVGYDVERAKSIIERMAMKARVEQLELERKDMQRRLEQLESRLRTPTDTKTEAKEEVSTDLRRRVDVKEDFTSRRKRLRARCKEYTEDPKLKVLQQELQMWHVAPDYFHCFSDKVARRLRRLREEAGTDQDQDISKLCAAVRAFRGLFYKGYSSWILDEAYEKLIESCEKVGEGSPGSGSEAELALKVFEKTLAKCKSMCKGMELKEAKETLEEFLSLEDAEKWTEGHPPRDEYLVSAYWKVERALRRKEEVLSCYRGDTRSQLKEMYSLLDDIAKHKKMQEDPSLSLVLRQGQREKYTITELAKMLKGAIVEKVEKKLGITPPRECEHVRDGRQRGRVVRRLEGPRPQELLDYPVTTCNGGGSGREAVAVVQDSSPSSGTEERARKACTVVNLEDDRSTVSDVRGSILKSPQAASRQRTISLAFFEEGGRKITNDANVGLQTQNALDGLSSSKSSSGSSTSDLSVGVDGAGTSVAHSKSSSGSSTSDLSSVARQPAAVTPPRSALRKQGDNSARSNRRRVRVCATGVPQLVEDSRAGTPDHFNGVKEKLRLAS